MTSNGLDLCGSGWGQVVGFCEHDNENTGNSLTNVELSASEEGLCSMEFVISFVSCSVDSASWNSIVRPLATAPFCLLPLTRLTSVMAERAAGCSSYTVALNCKADRSSNTNKMIT